MVIEPKTNRQNRLMRGTHIEIVESLTNSINNFLNNEIKVAIDNNLWHLAILGASAGISTLSMAFFAKDDNEGIAEFLRTFVDKTEVGFDFSVIAPKLKEYRDIIAHRWYSVRGYDIALDESMEIGWRRDGELVVLNRRLYVEAYLAAFDAGGKIWCYDKILEGKESQVKKRMVKRYSSTKNKDIQSTS